MARFGRSVPLRPLWRRRLLEGPIFQAQSTLVTWEGDASVDLGLATTTAGSLLVLSLTAWDSGGPPSITQVNDTQSNTWAVILQPAAIGNQRAWLYAATATAGGALSVNIGFDVVGNGAAVLAEYLSGEATPLQLSGSPVTATGTSTTPATGTTTPSAAAVYVGFLTHNSATDPTITPTAPWVPRQESEQGTIHAALSLVDQANLSGGLSASWTLGASVTWVAGVAAFAPVLLGLKVNTLALMGVGR